MKRNHRISQQEKLKSPAETSMKMDSAIFPKNMRMVKPSKDLGNLSSDFNLNLSAQTQRKIKTGNKKQSLSSPDSHSFWSICSVVFIAWKHPLWKIYKETRDSCNVTVLLNVSLTIWKKKWCQRQKDYLFLCMSKAQKENCIMFLNSRKQAIKSKICKKSSKK